MHCCIKDCALVILSFYIQVNTIAWNESGDKILSGSDDCHLNIYDVGKNKVSFVLILI